MIDSANFDSGEDERDPNEVVVVLVDGARLPVTQTDDPLSGGHFPLGTSKAPPWSARERSGVIVHVVVAFEMAHGKYTRCSVARESPISNGLTTVAVEYHGKSVQCYCGKSGSSERYGRGANTKLLICKIGHGRIRHKPTR